MCTVAPGQLIDLLSGLHSKHPGVELKIVDSGAQALEERLLNGDLEVAICMLAPSPTNFPGR